MCSGFISCCWMEFLCEERREVPGIRGESQHTKVLAWIQTRLCDTCLSQVRSKTPAEAHY